MFRLKRYQEQTLEALERFLADARLNPVADAYTHALERQGKPVYPYRHYDFAEVPYVCLRLPTGGGKTVLASHAVKIATRAYMEQDYPIVLWLVPTTTIRNQTLEALKKPGHPYRAELDRAFDQRVKVLDVEEVTQIRPHDIGSQVIVVVSTLANLRVSDTSGRKVYAYHEDFEPHFAGVSPHDERLERVKEEDLKENGLGPSALGKIKYSFANLLALKRPLVIMDEAHNARTPLTFETVKRIHPACVIEFTATPDQSATSASNVLYHVSASELKAEEMIKLPIMLTEHNDWQAAVRDAVLTRNKLATEAQQEPDYIRPIVLFQADKRNQTVTWQVLKQHLMDELKIEEEKIAIVTGTQRELDGINLFARGCPIEYIITVEALKEGWDCSFAYVFCSVRDVRSSRDAEQLLGRVLRMPFAKRRQVEALNRAYAHLASPFFARAAQELTDKLINMGFEAMEVPAHLQHGDMGELFGGNGGVRIVPPVEPPLVLELTEGLEVKPEQVDILSNVAVTVTEGGGCRVEVKGAVAEALKTEILRTLGGAEKRAVEAQIEQHNARVDACMSPSQRGIPFAPLPRLCSAEQGVLELLEPESFLFLNGDWSPLNFPVELPNFSLKKSDTTFEVDVEGKKVTYHVAEEKETYNLDLVDTEVTENDLARWLDRQLRSRYVTQGVMIRFLSETVYHLMHDKSFTLTALLRSKFLLVRAIQRRLALLQEQAAVKSFQQVLFGGVMSLETSFTYQIEFKPGLYPARAPFYTGRYKFRKHYYPVIEDLKVDGEEFLCAQAIDAHPQIKHWARNLVDRPHASFRLPLANGWFYPDFVAEMEDGRLCVIEYKGAAYKTNDDSREKNAIGKLWADKSGEKCLFLMAVETDERGRNVYQQMDDVVGR